MRFALRFLFSMFVALGTTRAHGSATVEPEARPRVLYLFAHQDDEVFILTKMARDVARGCEVHAAWITDGGRRGSAARRTAESESVMALLGVSAAHLHFLGFPDQGAVEHLPAIRERMQAIFVAGDFVELTTPAYEGGNIDHDVAALIGANLVRSTAGRTTHFEFPLYNHFNGRSRVGVFLPNSESQVVFNRIGTTDRQLIREAVRLHRSQRFLLMALRFRMDRRMMRELGEPYRIAPVYDFLERPARQRCRYEVTRRNRSRFNRWLEAVQPFLEREEASSFGDIAMVAHEPDALWR